MTRIALVGAGVVGSSWALVFARAGLDVVVHDADRAAAAKVADYIRTSYDDTAVAARDAALSRLTVSASLEEALNGADYIQESAPERVEIKTVLYETLDRLAAPGAILASSTSGLPASSFTEGLEHRQRCLVVHPINPPHLVPLVEIIPAPWTDPAVVDRAVSLMRAVRQSPVRLKREVNGFLVNRLQSAMLAEAFRLVEDGVCDAEDIDRAVTDGLGRRWAFLGPFETIDLNANDGIAEYCRKLGPMYYELAQEQADPRAWSAQLVATVERQLRVKTPAEALTERRLWRDRQLARLNVLKQSH